MERSISLIMPAYNEEEAIEFTVRSVKEKLKQHGFDYEILIFNDITLVTFLWEFAEYLIGKIPKLSVGFKKTFDLRKNMDIRSKWRDTILDIILNFSGAAIFIYLSL